MKRLLIISFVFFSVSASAQVYGPKNTDIRSIRQNSVSNLDAIGDTLWIGPALNRNIGNAPDWFIPQNADSVTFGRGRVFSLALGQDTVVTGLGYNVDLEGSSVATALGYYFSVDGGDDWRFSEFPLDNRSQQAGCSSNLVAGCDTTFRYGGQLYERIRITVPQQSPPFDIDFKDNVVLSVNWASGLLRSTDFGQTWDRIILPPISADSLVPSRQYEWTSIFQNQPVNRYDPLFDINLLGFGVLIDSNNRTWVGTAGGLNISDDVLTAPVDSISWKHIPFDNSTDGLAGGWIVTIVEQPGTNRIWMTNWSSDSQNRDTFAIVYTDDGGQTFKRFLEGQRINDITFKNGIIYAAGDNGLFISRDDGLSWQLIPRIESPNAFIKDGSRFFSAASTTNRVWIGTTDGIASTDDDGLTWQITRTDVPLDGGNFYQDDTPTVETYAYPNPFSQNIHSVVRMKFEISRPGNVRIRIFDFGMNLVRSVLDENLSPGEYDAVWNGMDDSGRKVANGTYFYIIESQDGQSDGKILVID